MTTSAAQGFWGKEATDYKQHVWSGEKNRETFTAFKIELQHWAGTLHDSVMKVMKNAD